MDGVNLILAAEAAGLTVQAAGDKLVIRGPRRAEAVAKLLLARKPLVMAALRALAALQSPAPPPLPAGPVCRRHPRGGVVDVPIHNGRSVRRDCATCHRFIDFVLWYGASRN